MVRALLLAITILAVKWKSNVVRIHEMSIILEMIYEKVLIQRYIAALYLSDQRPEYYH
jgi:hypothetical protein